LGDDSLEGFVKHLIADVLIPGRGEPISGGTVVMDDGIIAYAGPNAGAPALRSDDTVVEVPALMPGMWDCHAHFVGMPIPDLTLMASGDPITSAVRSVADIGAMLEGGITSAREVGGFGLSISSAIEEGSVAGPWTYAAGMILSTTAGHGDIHALPVELVHDIGCRYGFSILCDGVPEVLKAVRMNLRKNAKLIKLCASGGVMSEVDHPQHQQFSDEELAAIVAEAGRAERIVAAHCHGKAGIMAALRAGCHTIEHGSWLDEEAADLMIEQDAMFVPTRFVVESLLGQLDLLPPYAAEKGIMVSAAHQDAMAIAIEKGVRIATGCDIFVSGQMYGDNSREILHLINAGMTDLQAIEAATANGPETLGPQAPKSGQLIAGYDADVIAFDRNPLDDRSVWGNTNSVTHVWQRGKTRKQPER
jgi:imidazolonepropionase-like amidohydrolase